MDLLADRGKAEFKSFWQQINILVETSFSSKIRIIQKCNVTLCNTIMGNINP